VSGCKATHRKKGVQHRCTHPATAQQCRCRLTATDVHEPVSAGITELMEML